MSVLNEAKLNLKNSLNNLEKAIDVKIKQLSEEREQFKVEKTELLRINEALTANAEFVSESQNKSDSSHMLEELAVEVKKLNTEISDKIDEISYLRGQNSELNGKLGSELDKNNNLNNLLDDTTIKIDFMISEINQYFTNNRH